MPIGFEINKEINIQCSLRPPLVETTTEFSDYILDLSTFPIDNDFLNSIISDLIDNKLIEKLGSVENEIQLSSTSGRDNDALIVQCFVAASLADAYDGILFDPQEYGASHGQDVYEITKKLCLPAIDNDQDYSINIKFDPTSESIASKLTGKIEDIKCFFNKNRLLSPYFEDLSQGHNIKFPYLSDVLLMRKEIFVEYKLKSIKQKDTNGASSFNEYLVLKMLNINYNLEKFLLEASQKCFERSLKNAPSIWIQMRLACVKTIADAEIPDKTILLKILTPRHNTVNSV